MKVRRIFGLLTGVFLVWLGLAVSEANAKCPPDSVESGNTCIDKYEASVWQTTDASLVNKIKSGRVTLSDLNRAGATQLGLLAGDLAAAGCPANGNGCTDVYAVSIAGVQPARNITWFQAVAAARNSGKRLPSNAEWQAAALGTPDPGTDNESTDCNIDGPPFAVTPTGARANCVSDVGAFDMVGNLWEWVADWVPVPTVCLGELISGTGDLNCVAGASTVRGPGVVLRGGSFDFDTRAGVFAVNWGAIPPDASFNFGFRAAR